MKGCSYLRSRFFQPLLLLFLFASYQTGVVMFTHVHYVGGVIVAHSHPFQDSHHSHSLAEYLLIQQMGHIQMLAAEEPLQLEKPLTWTAEIAVPVLADKPEKTVIRLYSLRAPPSSVF